jgi:hypothetical protein
MFLASHRWCGAQDHDKTYDSKKCHAKATAHVHLAFHPFLLFSLLQNHPENERQTKGRCIEQATARTIILIVQIAHSHRQPFAFLGGSRACLFASPGKVPRHRNLDASRLVADLPQEALPPLDVLVILDTLGRKSVYDAQDASPLVGLGNLRLGLAKNPRTAISF